MDGLPVQRRVALDDGSDFKTWDGTELNSGSAELDDVLEELEDDFDWHGSQVSNFEELVHSQALYTFRDFDHLNDYLGGNTSDQPEIEQDEGAAMELDAVAKEFGANFKGPGKPFSGSRVYAVGIRGGVDASVWATQNSATGYVTKKQQDVVRQWTLSTPVQAFVDKIEFPSNSKRVLDTWALGRPATMASNAHAEVNQYVQLAIFAAAHGLTPESIGLSLGSDIAHCAECYWALAALRAKGTGTFASFTGCENKLFERWRQPWSGFYASYGPNPFRNANGTFKVNALTGLAFTNKAYSAAELNYASPYQVYT